MISLDNGKGKKKNEECSLPPAPNHDTPGELGNRALPLAYHYYSSITNSLSAVPPWSGNFNYVSDLSALFWLVHTYMSIMYEHIKMRSLKHLKTSHNHTIACHVTSQNTIPPLGVGIVSWFLPANCCLTSICNPQDIYMLASSQVCTSTRSRLPVFTCSHIYVFISMS